MGVDNVALCGSLAVSLNHTQLFVFHFTNRGPDSDLICCCDGTYKLDVTVFKVCLKHFTRRQKSVLALIF